MVTITSESDCGKKGGALACLGRKVEATIVTSTFLPKMMQDAHLHLDEAIATTTPSPSPLSIQKWGKGVAMDTPPRRLRQGLRLLLHFAFFCIFLVYFIKSFAYSLYLFMILFFHMGFYMLGKIV